MAINSMALPPIIKGGSKALKDKIVRDVVTGKKHVCLAISEPWAGGCCLGLASASCSPGGTMVDLCPPLLPFALHRSGSDVSAIRTSAVKTPDGKFYVVNGEKKWITGGYDRGSTRACCIVPVRCHLTLLLL